MVSEFSNFVNKKFSILQARPFKINLFILINVFMKSGFNNLKINYLVGYINSVNPKIIVTFNDIDLNFYKLNKYLSPKIKMIAIQHTLKIKKNWKFFTKSKINFKIIIMFCFQKIIRKYTQNI